MDVILTNPPFGGEEEAGIKSNFPDDLQTSETALLFLQLHMRLLKRPEKNNGKPGRAAVVVPNGTLFGRWCLCPYQGTAAQRSSTSIPLSGYLTGYSLLTPESQLTCFFSTAPGRRKPSGIIEIPLPEGRKNYTKTKPMQFEEFADCITWFRTKNREDNDHAWQINADEVLKYDDSGALISCNLDLKNPNRALGFEHLPPEQIAAEIIETEQRIIKIVQDIRSDLEVAKE